jgi:hypothetical protein
MTILPAAWLGGIRSCLSRGYRQNPPAYERACLWYAKVCIRMVSEAKRALVPSSRNGPARRAISPCFVTDDAIPGYLGTMKWAFCITRAGHKRVFIARLRPRARNGVRPFGWPLDCTREVGVLWVYARRQVPVNGGWHSNYVVPSITGSCGSYKPIRGVRAWRR